MMKNLFTIHNPQISASARWISRFSLIALMMFGLMTQTLQTKACIDLDSTVIVICNYDSNYVDMELRITNLRLMQEQPNKFCTCAISSYAGVFTDLKYVAFVDSGTNNVYPDFAPWSNDMMINGAWDTSQPGNGGWQGFVAEVINSGLNPTAPVELIVRAGLPPGYTFSLLDSAVTTSAIAADEWDNVAMAPANSHQQVRRFWDSPSLTYTGKSAQYFEDLDAAITTSIKASQILKGLEISPNPVQDLFEVSFYASQSTKLDIALFDLMGRKAGTLHQGHVSAGNNVVQLPIGDLELRTGTYLLRIVTNRGILTRKVLKIE